LLSYTKQNPTAGSSLAIYLHVPMHPTCYTCEISANYKMATQEVNMCIKISEYLTICAGEHQWNSLIPATFQQLLHSSLFTPYFSPDYSLLGKLWLAKGREHFLQADIQYHFVTESSESTSGIVSLCWWLLTNQTVHCHMGTGAWISSELWLGGYQCARTVKCKLNPSAIYFGTDLQCIESLLQMLSTITYC